MRNWGPDYFFTLTFLDEHGDVILEQKRHSLESGPLRWYLYGHKTYHSVTDDFGDRLNNLTVPQYIRRLYDIPQELRDLDGYVLIRDHFIVSARGYSRIFGRRREKLTPVDLDFNIGRFEGGTYETNQLALQPRPGSGIRKRFIPPMWERLPASFRLVERGVGDQGRVEVSRLPSLHLAPAAIKLLFARLLLNSHDQHETRWKTAAQLANHPEFAVVINGKLVDERREYEMDDKWRGDEDIVVVTPGIWRHRRRRHRV